MGEGKDAQAVQQQQAPGAAACAPLASGFERLKPPQHRELGCTDHMHSVATAKEPRHTACTIN